MPRAYDAFELDGQRYERVGERPYTRQDGRLSILVTWQANCRECGQPFTVDRIDKPVLMQPIRRCQPCINANPPPQLTARIRNRANRHPYAADTPVNGEVGHSAPRTEQPAPRLPSPELPAVAPPQARQQPGRQRQSAPPATGKGVFTDR